MKESADKAPLFGKFMLIAGFILALALLTMFFNEQLEQQRNPNRQLRTVTDDALPTVQLQRNRFGHYVATGAINGQPVEFMLDTGATDVSVPAGVADRLGLERGRRAVYQTANGPITAWRTRIAEVQLGPLRVGPVAASINPNDKGSSILLGMSFLRELDFSQQGNTLTLSYPEPGGN